MSTETDTTNPETGVDGEGKTAPNDDIDTSAFDRMEAPADEDDTDTPKPDEAGGETGDDADADKLKPDDEDLEEVELADGRKVKAPKELALGYLRQADYTQKTQEVAEQRRALETEKSTWETQREESRAALPEEHAKVAVLNHSVAEVDRVLKEYQQIDWTAWQAQVANLPADDPNRVKYMQYRENYLGLRDRRVNLEDQLTAAKTDLQTKETARLESSKAEADKALAAAFEETGKALAADIKGWNGELAGKTAKFMVDNLGATPAEIRQMTDPRMWKMGHEIMTGRARIAELEKALKQHQKADDNTRAQETKPAERTKGSGGANARDPSTPRGDGLSTEEWMRRRQAQVSKKRT